MPFRREGRPLLGILVSLPGTGWYPRPSGAPSRVAPFDGRKEDPMLVSEAQQRLADLAEKVAVLRGYL